MRGGQSSRRRLSVAVLSCCLSIASPLLSGRAVTRRFQPSHAHSDELANLFGTRRGPGVSVVLVDADNVRGKAQWAAGFSCAELTDSCACLARETGPLALVFDHAERRSARHIEENFAVCFTGPVGNADDVLVESVEWWASQSEEAVVVLVTSDFGLRARASQAVVRAATKTVSPGIYDRPSKKSTKARLRFVSSYALGEVLKERTEQVVSSYTARPFAAALRRLASHLNRAPKQHRPKGMAPKPRSRVEVPIQQERTWMRVVLAEKMRVLLLEKQVAPALNGTLAKFLHDSFSMGTDVAERGTTRVLQHPLSDRKQRSELLRFALAIANKEQDLEEEEETILKVEQTVDSALYGTRRVSSQRPGVKRTRRRNGMIAKPKPPRLKEQIPDADREMLELALYDWLRNDDDDESALTITTDLASSVSA